MATSRTINREPTAASGKWISVEDELPALDERVFFITGLYDLKIGYTHYTEENEADLDAPLPVFQDDEDHEPYFISEGDVRYWMPIPKLTEYEGERGSDGDEQDDQGGTGIHPGSTEISDKEAREADRQRRAKQLRERAILWGRRCDPGRSSSGSGKRDD